MLFGLGGRYERTESYRKRVPLKNKMEIKNEQLRTLKESTECSTKIRPDIQTYDTLGPRHLGYESQEHNLEFHHRNQCEKWGPFPQNHPDLCAQLIIRAQGSHAIFQLVLDEAT